MPEAATHVKSLARGLQVLRCYQDTRGPLSLTEIARRTQLPLPTVLRLVRTLVAEDFLEQTEAGEYRPSVALLRLGFAALDGLNVVQAADEPLRELARTTMETVNLGVLDDVDTRYLLRIRNADLVTANIRVGSRLPAGCSSMGKLLLAYLPEPHLADRLERLDLAAAQGPNAIRDRKVLLEELRQIRLRDWASQDEELAYGLRSIAVPIRDRTGAVIAATNIAVPATRWTMAELIERFLPPLQEAATTVTRRLTGQAASSAAGDTPAASDETETASPEQTEAVQ